MSDRKQDFDFLNATGQAFFEWTSPHIATLKVLDECAFKHYQESPVKNHEYLFTDPANIENIKTATFGKNISGEFFANIKIGKELQLGDNVNLVAHGPIKIGDNVKIGNNVQFITVFHSIHPDNRIPIRTSPLIIEGGAVIESGALVVSSRADGRPLIIGKNARVLADSVVVADVKEDAVVGGRPARVLDKADELLESFTGAARQQDLTALNNKQELIKALGCDANIFLPFYIEGAEHLDLGNMNPFINRNSRFSLKGPFSISQALFGPSVSVSVAEGASVSLAPKVWFGAGATIKASEGEHIVVGEGSIIAAGATVTKSVPPMSIVVGNDQVKKVITDNDLDSTMPAWWGDLAHCIELADTTRASIEDEVAKSLSTPEELVAAIRSTKQGLIESANLYQQSLSAKPAIAAGFDHS